MSLILSLLAALAPTANAQTVVDFPKVDVALQPA